MCGPAALETTARGKTGASALRRSAAVAQTSRRRVTRTNKWNVLQAPEVSTWLRLVEDDTAALRRFRNQGQCADAPLKNGDAVSRSIKR